MENITEPTFNVSRNVDPRKHIDTIKEIFPFLKKQKPD
jgi:hypothetical protein